MNTRKNKIQKSHEELLLQELEQKLYAVPKPLLHQQTKDELKNHLLSKLTQKPEEVLPFSLLNLVDGLRFLARKTIMPPWAMSAMRVRVKEYVAEHTRIPWYKKWWSRLSAFGIQKMATAFVLGIFFVMIFFNFPLAPNVTYAAPLVYVEELQGDVVILREQQLLHATEDMELKEGDAILTKEGSTATLHFFDDTVSRLDQNTSLILQRVSSKPSLPSAGIVEIFLEEGRLWTQAFPWFENSRFTVETDMIQANVDKKALFDVKATEESTEVTVAESIVEVVSKHQPYAIPKTVVAGYKLSTDNITADTPSVEKWERKNITSLHDDWLIENMKREEKTFKTQTDQELKSKNQRVEFQVAEDEIPAVRSLHEEFSATMGVFQEAQQLLEETQIEAAGKRFNDFLVSFSTFTDHLKALEKEDLLRAELTRKIFQDKLSLFLKDLRNFYPDSNMYKAKEVLQEAQLLLAGNETERIHQQFLQATTMLLDIEQLLQEHKRSVAGVLLKRYQNLMDSVLANKESFNFKQDKNVIEFIQNLVDHIKHLTALEQQLSDDTEYSSIRHQLQNLRKNLLRKFIINVELLPKGVPEHLLYEVKDLYDTYANDDLNEKDLIEPAVQKIIEKDYEVSFIKPIEGSADPLVNPNQNDPIIPEPTSQQQDSSPSLPSSSNQNNDTSENSSQASQPSDRESIEQSQSPSSSTTDSKANTESQNQIDNVDSDTATSNDSLNTSTSPDRKNSVDRRLLPLDNTDISL